MKKQNGDARVLGTRKAVLAIAVSLYAAIAGAQTSSTNSVAPSTNSSRLVIAQATPIGCSSLDPQGCKPEPLSLLAAGDIGIAAAGAGSTSSAGSPGGDGSGNAFT